MVRVIQPGLLLLALFLWADASWAQRGGFHGGGGFRGGGFHGGGGRGMHGPVTARPGIGGGGRLSHPGFRAPAGIPPRAGIGAEVFPSHPFHVGPRFARPGVFPNPRFRFFAPGFRRPGFGFFFRSPFFGFGTSFFSLGAIPIATFPWAPFESFYYYGFPGYTSPAPPPISPAPSYSEQTAEPSQPYIGTPSQARAGVLAFKDGTMMEVIDYWLQGDQIYYLNAEGAQGSAPIDRLDLPRTQQLNRERRRSFVLESRP